MASVSQSHRVPAFPGRSPPRRTVLAALAAVGLFALAGCDGGASAVKAPTAGERAQAHPAAGPVAAPATAAAAAADPRDAPVRRVDGRPIWAANQRRTAEENAQRGFERNGAAFGATTVDDYVRAAHAFVANPPKGSETLERNNGDRLIYDPRGNVFAVVTRAGAPRALFKPDDGAAYWAQQKAREARRTSAAKAGEARTGEAADSG